MAGQTNAELRRFLTGSVTKAVKSLGYELTRMPGRGLSSVWSLEKDGKTLSACIRTTRDRWYAFPPLDGGEKWKTLDDVDLVLVGAVNSKEAPSEAEVYMFPAHEVRSRFDEAYAARTSSGERLQPDNYGMWVNLDPDNRPTVSKVGSGIARQFPPIARYPLSGLHPNERPEENQSVAAQATAVPAGETIADVISHARLRIAQLAGVQVDTVKLELKIGY